MLQVKFSIDLGLLLGLLFAIIKRLAQLSLPNYCFAA